MKLHPVLLYRALCFAQGMLFGLVMTMLTPFKIEVAQLSPIQLVTLGTIMEVTIFLCEVPTGVVADVVSRRLSVLLGCILYGIAFIYMALAPHFWAQAIAAVIWGVGETFVSGAREAWIADEIPHSAVKTVSAGEAFVLGTQSGFLGRFIGVWAAAAFAIGGLDKPLMAGGIGFLILAILIVLILPEKGFSRQKDSPHSFSVMLNTAKTGVRLMRTRLFLALAMAATFIVGWSSEGFDRLWQKLVTTEFSLPNLGALPEATWWSILNSAGLLTSVAVVTIIRRKVDMESQSAVIKAMAWAFGLLTLALAAFGSSASFPIAVAGFLAVRSLRQAIDPLNTAWLNLNADSKVRATVLSFSGQAHSIGEIVGGPPIGLIAQFVNLRASMFLSAILALPGPFLLIAAWRKAAKEPEPISPA